MGAGDTSPTEDHRLRKSKRLWTQPYREASLARGLFAGHRGSLVHSKLMTGAESLVRTLVAGGVQVCFANPGTSEIHFVAALDRVEGIRCVLTLFEGVATGAADGYYRMSEVPAATLLHLGPGLAN